MFPLSYSDKLLGALAIHYVDKNHLIGEDEISLLNTVANQIAIAIHQAKLYKITKIQAERETVLRKIVETIGKSVDINQMKSQIVKEIGEFLDVDRCIIHQIDQKTGKFNVIDEFSEYKILDDLASYVGVDLETPTLKFFRQMYINKEEIIAPNWPEYFADFENVDVKTIKWIESLDIKSNYVFPIIYQEKLLAVFYLTYTKKYKKLSDFDLRAIRLLVNQISIALHLANSDKVTQSITK